MEKENCENKKKQKQIFFGLTEQQIADKMSKLKKNGVYYIKSEEITYNGKISNSSSSNGQRIKKWYKNIYVGENGYNNKLLEFNRVYRVYDGVELTYKVFYLKSDYLLGLFNAYDKEEYNKIKSNETWDKIYKLINETNGKDGYVV